MRRTLVSVRSESRSIFMPTGGATEAAQHRLLVVVRRVNEAALLARRIHEIASEHRADVLLIGAAADGAPETELRRHIATLAAFLQDAGTQVEVRIEQDWEWLDGVRFLLSEKDLVACCGPAGGTGAHPGLPDRLSSRLRRPIYVIEEPVGVEAHGPGSLRGASAWIGSLAVIAGFLWLQIRVSQAAPATAGTVLLFLTVPLEIALIWLCNAALG
jgi:hypothetical protein